MIDLILFDNQITKSTLFSLNLLQLLGFKQDECKDIETLAKTISGKTWEEFRK